MHIPLTILIHRTCEVEMLKGAIVFIAAFLLFLAITLGYQALPPGRAIYDAVVGAEREDQIVVVQQIRVAGLADSLEIG